MDPTHKAPPRAPYPPPATRANAPATFPPTPAQGPAPNAIRASMAGERQVGPGSRPPGALDRRAEHQAVAGGAVKLSSARLPGPANPAGKGRIESIRLGSFDSPSGLYTEQHRLFEVLSGTRVNCQALEDLVGSTLTAIARFGQKRGAGGESAGQPMPPLPEAPEDRLLHGIVVSVEDPQQQRDLRDLAVGMALSLAPTLRPDAIALLYEELADMVRQVPPGDAAARHALAAGVLSKAGELTLAQFQAMVQAVTASFARSAPPADGKAGAAAPWHVAASFFGAVKPETPAPQVAALAAAMTQALVPAGASRWREGPIRQLLGTWITCAASMTPGQRIAAAMGLCCAYARQRGGTPEAAMAHLKGLFAGLPLPSHDDSTGQAAAHPLKEAFARGLMIALDPDRLLDAAASGIPLSPGELTPLLAVAIGPGPGRGAGGHSGQFQAHVSSSSSTTTSTRASPTAESTARKPPEDKSGSR